MDDSETKPDKIQFRVGLLEEHDFYDRISPRDSANEQARTMLMRYLWIMDQSMPPLSESEKKLITDVTNATWFGSPNDLRMLWASLADAQDHYYEKWGVEREQLVERARDWTAAECAAVVDWTDQFWAEHSA